MTLKLPSMVDVVRAICWGGLLSSVPAAIIGWRTAAIFEDRLDQIYAEARANGGAIIIYIDDTPTPD